MNQLKRLHVFVKTSTVRRRVLDSFTARKEILTPAEISRSTKLFPSMISTALRQLEKEKLVICLTPKKGSWKSYEITALGKEVLRFDT